MIEIVYAGVNANQVHWNYIKHPHSAYYGSHSRGSITTLVILAMSCKVIHIMGVQYGSVISGSTYNSLFKKLTLTSLIEITTDYKLGVECGKSLTARSYTKTYD